MVELAQNRLVRFPVDLLSDKGFVKYLFNIKFFPNPAKDARFFGLLGGFLGEQNCQKKHANNLISELARSAVLFSPSWDPQDTPPQVQPANVPDTGLP